MQAAGPMSEGDKRRLVLKLVARLRCVQCQNPYDPHDFTLVHNMEDMWVLSTRCRHCDELCHVVVYMRLGAEPEPIIDLTPEEVEAADNWSPITTDDLLDVHAFLQEFDGDFDLLFSG